MKKKILLLILFLFSFSAAFAQLQDIHGVIPTENVTSLEILPRFKAKDDSQNISIATLEINPTFKLNQHWKFGAEIPLSRYGEDHFSKKGLGDIITSFYYTDYSPNKIFSYGIGAEMIWPTASSSYLGKGKAIAEPEIFLVWKISPHFFIETEYRHIFSYAANSGREDIHQSRYRMILGYMSDDKWWIELDPRYIVDYENSSASELIAKAEIGTMINTGSAIYARAGWHLAGNRYSHDWEFMVGFKILYL